MKEIKLTQGFIALVDDEDFERVSAVEWIAAKRSNTVYAATRKKPEVLMHRWLFGVNVTSTKVDHEDHNGLNNQKYNLRVCTHAQNCANQKLSTFNTSGFKGVSYYKRDGNWSAYIKVDGKKRHLGYYSTAEEAAQVYDSESIKVFGEFALTNTMMAQKERSQHV